MDLSKFEHSVPLHCPTCTSSHFSYEPGSDDDQAIVTCASCGCSMSRSDLIESNSESIQLHLEDVGEQAAKATADEIARKLKDAFRGNKFITIK